MGTAVDVGDAATSLEQSRADASATAKAISGGALTAPDVAPAPPLKIGRAPQIKPSRGLGPPDPRLTAPDVEQPADADSIPHGDLTPPPPPTPQQTAAKPGTFDQTGSEVGNGVMRFYAHLGKLAGKVMGVIGDEVSPDENNYITAGANILKKAADDAAEYWQPTDPSKSGIGAQVLGDVASVVPALAMGPVGAEVLPAEAGSTAYDENIKAGEDVKTAATLATIAAGSTALGMKIPLKSPNIWKRIGSSILGNEAISAGTQELTKMILNSQGYKDAAAKIDLSDPRSILSTLAIAIGFGLHRQAGATPKEADEAAQNGTKVGQPPAPDPSQTAPPSGPSGDSDATPPSPPPPGISAATPTLPTVPDAPSIEPAKDLRAQIKDMNDKNTPRVGVLIAKDSLTSLQGSKDVNALSVNGTLNQARTQGRTILLPQGELMLKSAKIAKATQARLDAGEDPQAVIGSVTGAGDGKSPDQTVVVQGQTPTGAVATETGVSPDAAHIAVQKAVDQGHTPVVTTPEAAVARRIDEVSKERNTPVQMGIMTRPDGTQLAVHVEPGAPDGMVRVRQLDADGEPTASTIDVDAQRVKIAPAATEAPGIDDIDPVNGIDPVKGTKPASNASGGTTESGTRTLKPEVASPIPSGEEAVTPPKVEETPPVSAAEDTSQPSVDRRKDAPARKRISEMTPEEKDAALYRDHKTGIKNERAYDEDEKPVHVSVDLDSLKWYNDNKGMKAGDEAIQKTADALDQASGGNAYRTGGDEFMVKADSHEEAEKIIADAKSKLAQDKIGISHGIGNDKESADIAMKKNKAEREKTGERAARGETPPMELNNETAPAPKLKAKKIETALEALPKALETHEQQEQIPEGKKFPASLSERQENASLFAKILKSAADAARGKAEPDVVERAIKAAKAAESLADKGKEETAKGQGTSHVRTTALVAEMHKAARGLLGIAREGDAEVVRPKEAELKAKQERTRKRLTAKTKEGATGKTKEGTSEPKIEVPVNEKYKGDIKDTRAPEPKQTAQVQREAQRLMERFIHADEADMPALRTEVEQFLHEHMSDQYTPDEIKDVLQLLHEQRIEQNPEAKPGPRRMSDTIEDETHGLDTSDKGLKTLGLRKASKHALSLADKIKAKVFNNRMWTEWQRLGSNLYDKDGLSDLIGKVDSGEAVGAHEVLNRIIEHTDTPVLKSLLQNLRSKVPDLPVHFVSKVIDLRNGLPYNKGLGVSGLFNRGMDSVQVRPKAGDITTTVRTIIHELVHAATSYEVHENPNGALAIALEKARVVLENRLKAKYGRDVIDQHKAYFNGDTTTKPDNYMRKLYGVSNVDEMMAELHSNPEFVQEIADSEEFARPGEDPLNDTFLGGAKTLLYKMYNAIGRFLGIQDPKLLQHIAGLTDKTMEVQHQRTAPGKAYDFLNKPVHDFEAELVTAMRTRFGANPLEISRALPSFMEIAKDPAPIPRESEIMHSFADDEEAREPTMVARLFRQAMNSEAVDAVRAIKMSLKTVPQIFRDGRRDFGDRDDPQNPLNRLADVNAEKTKIIHDMSEISRPVAKAWMKLKDADNKAVGALLRDATMYKLDPRKPFAEQTPEGRDDPKAAARHVEFETRYKGLTPESRAVFDGALDASRNLARAERRANIDTALEAFSDTPITDAQRTLLYGARRPEDFDNIVGDGKLIDVGDNNDKLIESLKDFAGQSELNGPYAHLGRHGDYVVTAEPEGSRRFTDEASARRFAKEVSDLSPNSKGTYVYRGGEHQVDYKVQYTSFHDTRNEAEAELQRMRDAGYKVGVVTRKTMSREDTPLSAGTRDLVAAAESKINRNGKSAGNDALVAGLRSAFLQLAAQRSAYAGSRMARKNFAGVKPEEMRRNFADHAQSTIWHTAQLRTTFKQASALAKLRDLARNPEGVDQQTSYRRGEIVDALNKHLKDEVANFGHRSPLNAGLARLGFMSYLASPSHAMIWMTQNFTTGIPVAGARWGYGRAAGSFGSAMKLLTSPALRETVHAIFGRGGGADEVNKAIIDAVKKDARFGKWAQGPNSHLQQLIDRGVLGHSYSNELHEMAQSGKPVLGIPATTVNKAFEWARLLPNMADSWNRVSTALAGLEMTGGDIRKTADFVDEVHADYSAEAKPLAFKKIGRVPGMNSVTMFKTYTQSMIHLFYGNLKAAMAGDSPGGRMESAKIAAGMVLSNALFAGVYGAAAIEPLRLALYAYHKLFDKEGEVYDLKNSIHRFLVDHLGKTGGDIAAGGLPHIAGFDLSSRMGLADLFFHEPPDLFSADKDAWKNFAYNEAGPMVSFLAERTSQFVSHMQRGEAFQAVSSLIPIKMYQDAVKAAQLATVGKTNSLGGSMTKPSAVDAAIQLFGLKPSDVADAQERTTTKIDYNAEVKATRESILKAFVSASPGQERAAAQKRINDFNKLHPAEAIKPTDQIKMMRYRQQSQSNAPTRDATLNKMMNY